MSGTTVQVNVLDHLGLARSIVTKYSRRYKGYFNKVDSEDLMSGVILRWLEVIQRYDPSRGMLSTFLTRVAVTACNGMVRKAISSNRDTTTFSDYDTNVAFEDVIADRSDEADINNRQQKLKLMEEVICGLENPIWRDCLVLRAQGWKIPEIAAKHGVSKQAIHSKMQKALRIVRERMELEMQKQG